MLIQTNKDNWFNPTMVARVWYTGRGNLPYTLFMMDGGKVLASQAVWDEVVRYHAGKGGVVDCQK